MQASAPRSKYRGPIKWLGGSALGAFLIGLVFIPFSRAVLSEAARREVIVQAIPFVAIFVAILLLFILSVALVGLRWHLLVPARTHRVVEFTTIVGIIAGIFFLFQPWHLAPYHYGFGMLLGSTLAFIVWSHIAPRGTKDDALLPPFTRRATVAGILAALLLSGAIFAYYAVDAQPAEPYGMRARRWATLNEAQQAEVVATAATDYRRIYLPFLALYSLIPGFAVFFIVREALTPKAKLEPHLEPGPEHGPPHTVAELEGTQPRQP